MISDYKINRNNSIKVSRSPFKFSFNRTKEKIELAPELNQDEDEILKYFGID